MSEIEKAIYTAKQAKTYIVTKYIENGFLDKAIVLEKHFDLAIQALQEKLERDKGCENCTKHTPINNFAKDYSIEVDNKEISIWEDYKCLAHIKINYCPICGRKLVE